MDGHPDVVGTPADMPIRGLDFSRALAFLKAGGHLERAGWNGKGMWVAVQFPDDHSKMTRPYIYMSCADGALVPWVASQSDLLADDWQVVEVVHPGH